MCFDLQVQLTLLTAIVKLFLKKPSETQELVQQVLSLATQVNVVFYSERNACCTESESDSDFDDLFLHCWIMLPFFCSYAVL